MKNDGLFFEAESLGMHIELHWIISWYRRDDRLRVNIQILNEQFTSGNN